MFISDTWVVQVFIIYFFLPAVVSSTLRLCPEDVLLMWYQQRDEYHSMLTIQLCHIISGVTSERQEQYVGLRIALVSQPSSKAHVFVFYFFLLIYIISRCFTCIFLKTVTQAHKTRHLISSYNGCADK